MTPRPPGWLLRSLTALAPLAATLLLSFLTMEGYVNFGGGDKDILVAIPLLLFSVLFLLSCLIAWWRGLPPGRAARVSALASAAVVVVAWLALFVAVMLQFGRR